MKKSFRQYKSMIWTQLYLTLVPLGLAVFAVIKGKPKNLDAWGIPILSFLLAATFFLCYSFYTFRTLVFTDDALLSIAQKAQEKETGARALRAIIEDIMLDVMYEIPKDDNIGRVTITREYLDGKGSPIIETRS